MKFSSIPKLTNNGNYKVSISWSDLIHHIDRLENNYKANLNPDYQRCHVWSKQQQIKYVEYKLSGGFGSDIILCNCPGWMNSFEGPYELVDSKQRITAVLEFLNNKIKAHNYYYNEYEDRLPSYCEFLWCVNDLNTKKEVMQWYVDINSNGVAHTDEEINKVKNMIKEIKWLN